VQFALFDLNGALVQGRRRARKTNKKQKKTSKIPKFSNIFWKKTKHLKSRAPWNLLVPRPLEALGDACSVQRALAVRAVRLAERKHGKPPKFDIFALGGRVWASGRNRGRGLRYNRNAGPAGGVLRSSDAREDPLWLVCGVGSSCTARWERFLSSHPFPTVNLLKVRPRFFAATETLQKFARITFTVFTTPMLFLAPKICWIYSVFEKRRGLAPKKYQKGKFQIFLLSRKLIKIQQISGAKKLRCFEHRESNPGEFLEKRKSLGWLGANFPL
jgi:hypothetical protein